MVILVYVLLSSLLMVMTTDGAKILFLPVFSGIRSSPNMILERVAEVLRDDGHHIVFYNAKDFGTSKNFAEIHFHLDDPTGLMETHRNSVSGADSTFFVLREYSKTVATSCQAMVRDKNALARLRLEEFDLAFTTNIFFQFCAYGIIDFLGVNHIQVGCSHFSTMVSEVPTIASVSVAPMSPFTDRMSFIERLQNTFAHVIKSQITRYYFERPTERLLKESGMLVSGKSAMEISRRPSLLFANVDFSIDAPHVYLPNVKFVGGLLAGPGHPLPSRLDQFYDGATDVIVMSFGASLATMTMDRLRLFTDVFKTLPYHVVWRLDMDRPDDLPDRVLTLPWLPQNDLVAHPKTKLIITHAGANTLWEAVYHGRPLLALPLFGVQTSNSHKAKQKGMAMVLRLKTVTAAELASAIRQMMETDCYRDAAKAVSALYHQKPFSSINETIRQWTSFVLNTGGAKHLLPASAELNTFQFYLMDVLGCLGLVGVLSVFLVVKCCSICLGGRRLKGKLD